MRPPRASTERQRQGLRLRGWRTALADDTGNASLEFIVVGLILLVPLAYLVIALGSIQGHTLGVEAAARHAARAISTATDATDASQRAERIIGAVADEYGLSRDDVAVRWDCAPAGVECPSAGATLILTVSFRAPLPLVPPVLGLEDTAAVPVEATAVQKVSRVWGTP
ncbi:TadE family protein [Microbacterium sp. NPDC089189]|uniref:TadE family protein n=1 Tax=Microbacterium sp. NPDC089189 TaxID=3154972 RepID=UPI003442761A